jgi:hypothetical protein
MTDDCLLIKREGRVCLAVPAYPALRLWPDSVSALQLESVAQSASALESGKWRLAIDRHAAETELVQLSALFVLQNPAKASGDGIEVAPLKGSQAMMALVESAFVLDLVSKESIRHNFALVSTLAEAGLPMFSLNFPRRYEVLSEVRNKVMDIVQSCTATA